MRLLTLRILAILLALMTSQLTRAADYAREKKWADEITPGIVVGDPVYLELKQGRKFLGIFTEAGNAKDGEEKLGIVVVHGIGIHPDWNMIGTLRTELAEYGYTTLSIQMPVLANDAQSAAYKPLFPEAAQRIAVAVDYLQARGYNKIAIVSHSLGSAMSHGYVLKNSSKLTGWASLGMQTYDYAGIGIPVLDLYGERDLPPVLKKAHRRAASLKGMPKARQVKLAGSDHFFTGHEAEMVQEVKTFLDSIR